MSQALAAGKAADGKPPAPLLRPYPKPKGLSYGGLLFTSIAPDLRMDGDHEDRFLWRSGLDFRVKYRFAPGARFQLSTAFRYQVRSGDDLEADAWLDLRDSYLAFRKQRLSLRVGRMVMRWGRNPLLSPLSVLSPLDSQRLFTGAGLDDPRIPVTAARLKLDLHPLALELVYLPFFQPARISFFGRDFSLLRPGMLPALLSQLQSMIPESGDVLLDNTVQRLGEKVSATLLGLDPYSRDGLQTYLAPSFPEEMPVNGDVGLRLGLSGGSVEADFYVLTFLLDLPSIELAPSLRRPLAEGRSMTLIEMNELLDPGQELATATYHRALMAGADVSLSAGGFVFTGELAWTSKSVHYSRGLEPLVLPSLHYALALRYSYGTVFGLDVEFAHRALFADPAPELLFQRQHDLKIAALLVARLFQDRLQLSFGGNWLLLQRDLYLHPRVRVDVDDRLAVVFGAQLFLGQALEQGSDFGALLTYQGGLAGYFQENDSVYGNVELRF
tara:strand:- start:1678 stop:3174 length:1497 start_codon:yes stop_codon:yes gene_type:complete